MPDTREPRPPFACRWLIRLASWIVPRRERREWSERWCSGVRDWWILVERGELTRDASSQFLRHCRCAFADAFWLRFSREELRYWVRAASFPLTVAALALSALVAATRGLAVTRYLVHVIRNLRPGGEEPLIAYGLPIVFALATAVALVGASRLSIYRQGLRYWVFFVVKTLAVMVLVTLLWIEGGAAFRGLLPKPIWSAVIGGLLLAILFIAVFARALLWSFDDQRRRCPVCLRLLAMPVSMGSRASVFEPVTTEMLCDEGHGSLCVSESETGEADRWISLDASWRDLFTVAQTGDPHSRRGSKR